MENFKENRKELDEELERFITLLNQLLPHYHFLLKKTDLNKEELNKLGEIEHYLIGVNSKIMEIKGKLEQDLFGQSLDTYYKLKTSAYEGYSKYFILAVYSYSIKTYLIQRDRQKYCQNRPLDRTTTTLTDQGLHVDGQTAQDQVQGRR